MQGARIGLIVNPVAGLGGAVGLKGSDGDLAEKALARGAAPRAAERALAALASLESHGVSLLTCAGDMGEKATREARIAARVVYTPARNHRGPFGTSAEDTRAAVRALIAEGVDLLLFVGGDGTARDVLEGMGCDRVPALGVPAGVKMHSAVFATSPRAAGNVAVRYLSAPERAALLADSEVLDRRESGERNAGAPTLYGFLRTPRVPLLVAHAKAMGPDADQAVESAIAQIAAGISEQGDCLTVLGPGGTMQRLRRELEGSGFAASPGSLLAVSVYRGRRCVIEDASEEQILQQVGSGRARLVVGVVGGQGFLFGRGNQQLSPRVLRAVGRENIVVVASVAKLADLTALLVDTGDDELDSSLTGFMPVLIGAGRTLVMPVRHTGGSSS